MPGDFCYVHSSPFEDNLNIIILFAKSTVLIICSITVKLCANGHNNSQQCWDLQCIVGRIHLIRLSNIVALRFGNHGTNEMLGVVGSKI